MQSICISVHIRTVRSSERTMAGIAAFTPIHFDFRFDWRTLSEYHRCKYMRAICPIRHPKVVVTNASWWMRRRVMKPLAIVGRRGVALLRPGTRRSWFVFDTQLGRTDRAEFTSRNQTSWLEAPYPHHDQARARTRKNCFYSLRSGPTGSHRACNSQLPVRVGLIEPRPAH